VPVLAADEFVFFLDRNRLMDCGIGFVDVHLLASARLAGVSLWTKDRHLRAPRSTWAYRIRRNQLIYALCLASSCLQST
jgi:hypothetical protein